MLSRFILARLLLVAGFLTGLGSLMATFGHIGDPLYRVSAEFDGGRAHSWYHALREGCADLSTLAVLLLVFFAGPRWRSPESWWLCLILLLGYYLPFWAGMPFVAELRAPSWRAELNHVAQALLALAGLWLARPAFRAGRGAPQPDA